MKIPIPGRSPSTPPSHATIPPRGEAEPSPAPQTASTGPVSAPARAPVTAVGGFKAPELLERNEPVYTKRAGKRREGGVVVLKVLVNEMGRIVQVVVEQGLPGSELEARAIDAALRSTYSPALQDGLPVRAWVLEKFVFGR